MMYFCALENGYRDIPCKWGALVIVCDSCAGKRSLKNVMILGGGGIYRLKEKGW